MAIKFFNDPSKLWNLTELLLQGAGVTLSIFFLTLLFAVPLGVLFAQARMSKHAVLRAPTSLYIYLMRSTPLMLQIMFVYFLLPQILPFKVDRFSAVIFAFAVNYAAYFAEIFRSGIQSIPAGQYEAAKVLAEHDVLVKVDMGTGEASAKAWGCDLTYDYVKINGDYRT